MSEAESCPCGSAYPYIECCGRYHHGQSLPATPEQLMRSRYTAFVLKNDDYLRQTWHPKTLPESLEMSRKIRWLGLEVVASGENEGGEGWVEFKARFMVSSRLEHLHERSRFVNESGRWQYLDGEIFDQPRGGKLGRNDPCPCGSGRKYKRCCGKSG